MCKNKDNTKTKTENVDIITTVSKVIIRVKKIIKNDDEEADIYILKKETKEMLSNFQRLYLKNNKIAYSIILR